MVNVRWEVNIINEYGVVSLQSKADDYSKSVSLIIIARMTGPTARGDVRYAY